MPVRVVSNAINISSIAKLVEHAVVDGLRDLPGDWAVSIEWPAGGDQYVVDVHCPELRKVWGLWGRLVEGQCIHLSEELSAIAERLCRVRTEGYAHWNPHQEALLELLERVKSVTGRYHYAEISNLINALYAYNALRHGRKMPDELIYDVDSLRMIVSRQRQLDARKWGKLVGPIG